MNVSVASSIQYGMSDWINSILDLQIKISNYTIMKKIFQSCTVIKYYFELSSDVLPGRVWI